MMADNTRLLEATSQLLDLDDLQMHKVLEHIAQTITKLMGASGASVCIPDCSNGWIVAYPPPSRHDGSQSVEPAPRCQECIRHAQPLNGSNGLVLRLDDRFLFRIPLRRYRPQTSREDSAILICVEMGRPQCSSQLTDAELNIFAQIAGLSVENALRDWQQYIFGQASRRFVTDESGTIDGLAVEIAARMRYEACTIFTVARDTGDLRVVGTTGIETDKHRLEWRFAPGGDYAMSDPAAKVANERHVFTSEQHDSGLEAFPDSTETDRKQFLIVPVLSDADTANGAPPDLIGVVRFRNKQRHALYVKRPIDWLDLVEAELMATALSSILLAIEAELMRAEAISTMRHDMANPIIAIENLADLFANSHLDDLRRDVARIQQKQKDIISTCKVLHGQLNLSRVLSYRDLKYDFVPCKLMGEIVVKLNKSFADQCKRARLRGIFTDDFASIPEIYVDQDMMHVVFYNLFHNAIKYSHSGTSIEVTTDADRSWYYINIENYGMGVGPEDRERVFRKWYRSEDAKKSGKRGLGLGLFHVREILRLHGGKIEITRLHTPTVFTIRLPRELAFRKPNAKNPVH